MMFWIAISLCVQSIAGVDSNHYKVHQGKSISLNCVLPANVSYAAFRRTNNSAIAVDVQLSPGSIDFTVIKNNENYTLIIQNAQKTHSGQYICGLFDGSQIFETYNVLVLVPPSKPIIKISPLIVNENNECNLTCFAEGASPNPSFEWFRSNSSLQNLSTITSGQHESILTISKVKAEEHGTEYKCSVINEAISNPLQTNYILNVHYGPRVTLYLNKTKLITSNSTVSLVIGTSAVFSVAVKSNPPFNFIKWEQSNDSVSLQETLELKSINNSAKGEYKLVVGNSAGISITYFTIQIMYSPSVNITTVNNVVNLGDELKLSCKVNSFPPIRDIYWQRNDFNLTLGYNNLSINSEFPGQSILRISPITQSDAGTYSCVTINQLIPYKSRKIDGIGIAHINVTVRFPPSVNMLSRKMSVELKSIANVVCIAKGIPYPEIDWIRDDHSIPCSQTNITNGLVYCSLKISPILQSSFGKYTCRAKNLLGTDIIDIDLTTKKEPEIPVNISLSSKGHSWIYFCWIAGYDGGYAQSFVIDSCIDRISTTSNCINLTNILETERCDVRIRSQNSIGFSRWTQYSLFSTLTFPFHSKDMPFIRDTIIEETDIYFDMSPARFDLSFSFLCLQLYFSTLSPNGNTNVLFDKYENCLPLKNENRVSIKSFLKERTGISQLRGCLCAIERQSVCGEEVIINLPDISYRPALSPYITALVIIFSAIVSGMLTFCFLCIWKRHFNGSNCCRKRKRNTKCVKEQYPFLNKRMDIIDYNTAFERAKTFQERAMINSTTFTAFNDDATSISIDPTRNSFNPMPLPKCGVIEQAFKPDSPHYEETASESGYSTPTNRHTKALFEATV